MSFHGGFDLPFRERVAAVLQSVCEPPFDHRWLAEASNQVGSHPHQVLLRRGTVRATQDEASEALHKLSTPLSTTTRKLGQHGSLHLGRKLTRSSPDYQHTNVASDLRAMIALAF
jgi:hypothetical protein